MQNQYLTHQYWLNNALNVQIFPISKLTTLRAIMPFLAVALMSIFRILGRGGRPVPNSAPRSLLTVSFNFGSVSPYRTNTEPVQKTQLSYWVGCSGQMIFSASSVFTRISMTRYFFQAISWLASSSVAIPKSFASCRG